MMSLTPEQITQLDTTLELMFDGFDDMLFTNDEQIQEAIQYLINGVTSIDISNIQTEE